MPVGQLFNLLINIYVNVEDSSLFYLCIGLQKSCLIVCAYTGGLEIACNFSLFSIENLLSASYNIIFAITVRPKLSNDNIFAGLKGEM